MSLRYDIKNIGDTKTYVYFRPTESNELDNVKASLEHDDKIDVYPNNKDTYKNITDYIYRIVNSGVICKGLNPSYILDAFGDVDAVVVIGSTNILPNGNVFGFALIIFDEKNNSIYIDIICSHMGIKGAGDILMNEIEHISRKLLMTRIYLESVESAISFYEKYGFIKHDETDDGMLLMIKSINTKNGGKKRKTNKERKSNKQRKSRKSRKIKKIKKTRKV